MSINSSLITVIVGIAIISTVIITSSTTTPPQNAFSLVTVGPVWTTNQWSCTSDADFMVYGALRSPGDSTLAISISELGTQSLYSFNPEQMQTFAVGSPAGHFMNITRTGIITGWITLQTTSGANANCIPT